MGARAYLLTLNTRGTDDEEFRAHKEKLISWEENLPRNIRGLLFQEEVGEQGTRHLQIYVCFKQPVRQAGVKRLFDCDYLHVEVCRDRAACITYCSKEETRTDGPWSFGQVQTRQGQRSDLEALQEAVKEGHSELRLFDDYFGPMLRYHRAIRVYRNLRMPATRDQPMVRCFWGPTGTGKTHRAFSEAQEFGEPYVATPVEGQLWVGEGYDGIQPLIIDEFNGQWPVNFMKRLLDKWPMEIPFKGGLIQVRTSQIWLTSNEDPTTWWWQSRGITMNDRNAIARRIHVTVHMTDVFPGVQTGMVNTQLPIV